MTRRVFWFDTETGGVNHETDALLQPSAIIEIDGKEVDSIDLKMRPLPGKKVHLEALQVQNRTMEDINSFGDPREAFSKFTRFIARHPKSKTDRYIMAGYNADFDCRFLNQWYRDITCGPYAYWDYLQFSPVDAIPILRAMRHYGILDLPDTKLSTVCAHFGIEINAHDSMSDIRATRELTNMLMERIKSNW